MSAFCKTHVKERTNEELKERIEELQFRNEMGPTLGPGLVQEVINVYEEILNRSRNKNAVNSILELRNVIWIRPSYQNVEVFEFERVAVSFTEITRVGGEPKYENTEEVRFMKTTGGRTKIDGAALSPAKMGLPRFFTDGSGVNTVVIGTGDTYMYQKGQIVLDAKAIHYAQCKLVLDVE